MTKHAYRRDIVDVAIAVVVDKLSDQNQQPRDFQDDSMEPRRDRSQLHVLISRRKKEQVLGGYWELPGGKVEPSETPTHAVVRELREEVGIEATPIETLSVVEHEYDHAHVRLHPFICQHTAGTPSAIEVDETHIQIPERADDEPPASAGQLQIIRQLSQGRSLQGYRFDYRKLGTDQAATIIDQLQTMNDQPTPSPRPSKQGPGCIVSLVKGTTALVVWVVVLAVVAGAGYLIYNHIQNNPKPTTSSSDGPIDPQDNTDDAEPLSTTGSTIFEGLDVSGTPDTTPASAPDKPERDAQPVPPAPKPAEPPAPVVDRELAQQLASLKEMLVKLSQYTRGEFAPEVRTRTSQIMLRTLDKYPKALAALDAADPTTSQRIRTAINAFAADQLDGPGLREDLKPLRQAIEALE
eukprot:g15306.t1